MATGTRFSTSLLTINTDVPEYFRCDTHCEGVLKYLRGRQDLCDVVLIVGGSGKRISAHRLILIASSDYFSALLSGGMRESQEREITLNDLDGDSLEKLVNFCYTGTLELQMDTIETLIVTASYLQLKEITEGCCAFLQRHLQPSNCFSFGLFAEQLNLEPLLHNAKKFIYENFEEVSNHTEFFLLSAEQLSEFLSSDDLGVSSEELVFQVVMKWIEYEPGNRRKHFTELLAQVRMPLLTQTFLTEKVQPLCNTTESQQLVLNALKSHLMPGRELSSQHRKGFRTLLLIYGDHSVEIAVYNLRTNKYTKWLTEIEHGHGFEVAMIDDNLIVVGGSIGCKVTCVNFHTMKTTEMTPLRTRRSAHTVAVLKGSIYAIEGTFVRPDTNTSVERWDPKSGTWSFITPMGNARYFPGVAVMNDILYVSGGHCNSDCLASVECYDPVKNSWKSIAPMKMARSSHCLAAYKGYLYAIGGIGGRYAQDYEDEGIPIERYDPRTDTWTTISCSSTIYGYTTCASVGSDLFIYNKSKIYMKSNEGSSDNLQLQILTKIPTPDTTHFGPLRLVVIPFQFSPPESWIENKDTRCRCCM